MTVMVAFLFYDSPTALVLFPLILIGNGIRFVAKKIEERHGRIQIEFKEMLRSIAESLAAGYSVENAFTEAEQSLTDLFGEASVLRGDIHYLNNKVQMGEPVERQFMYLVKKYPLDEIRTFGELFLFCKKMGGDYTKNMKRLALRIDEGIAVKEEILGQIAEKQLELNIMSVVPFGIIFYMRITAGGFMDPLYGSAGGAALMSVCLCLYGGSMLLGRQMIRSSMEV
ncbi:MAG: type II secretion system F family protein [Lachnospiraceae bacterium]|nr:type II secretion system F family protein [Lachnospiraceae bacterium]